MAVAYIGLGSNLSGNHNGQLLSPQAQLEQALVSLSMHHQIDLLRQSSFYQTVAIGPGKQPDYINAAAQLRTSLTPIELLDLLQSIENQQGRERITRWGARTLDLDILLYDQHTENSQRLILPHPRIHERNFVLAPLVELAPQLTLASGKNIAELLANCSMQGIVKL